MAIDDEDAKELIESVFDFDHVGDAMLAVRKDLNSADAQAALLDELIKAAMEELENGSPENREMITAAARQRVEKFIRGSKYSQSGCSGL